MSDRQPKRKRANAGDVADLFRVLRNMCFDEKVSDADFRIAFRIAQCVDADSGWGEAGDAFLSDEVPRTDRGKLKRFRRKMRDDLGWVRTIKGERGRATCYEFQETRCEEIEAARADAKEARHAQSALRKIQRDTAMKVASLGGDITPLIAIEADPITGEIYPLNEPTKGVKSTPVKGAGETPLLPHSSTSRQGYRQTDESPPASAPASAPMPARAHIPPPPLDDDDDYLIEVTPAQSHSAIRDVIPPPPPLDDDDLDDASPPEPANDPGAAYRRVRDGG